MEVGQGRFFKESRNRFGRDACACKEMDPAVSCLMEFIEQIDAVQTVGSLTGGQDGLDIQGNRFLKGRKGIAAHVKCTMQRDGHIPGMFAETFHLFGTQGTVRRKTSDYNAVGSGCPKRVDFFTDEGCLILRVQEITETGANQSMDADVGLGSDLFIKGEGGRRTADDKIRAKLEAVCTAFFCHTGRICGIDAAF